MRQMKRALSMVLAMVMLLGMVMVPTGAASSNFIDADLIENTEAVEITSGIGLFAGTTDGRFAPKATVTRAQMATIIVKMLRGNEFNADAFKGVGVNPFPDTAAFEGGWAEGYINACYQMGVVAGYGDGKFRPANELTTAEALTMIINALGVDPGPGEWPLNYLAKAEQMKLYGDLKQVPASDEPLNRDQLAVIVLAGLEYSPAKQTGWRIPGYDMVFENYADALEANGGQIAGISEAMGEDTLAHKVYQMKKATGFITGNQATGLKYTELGTLDTNTNQMKFEEFDLESSLNVMGHYVTIYYKEPYQTPAKPGKAYAIVDESSKVTVKESISTSKDYKTAFGTNYARSSQLINFDSYYVNQYSGQYDSGAQKLTSNNYTPGSKAPAGTYILVDGQVVAYVAPVTTYASYISDIGTVEDEEYVSMPVKDTPNSAASVKRIPNSEDDDQIVEYAGMKVGDYVTYQKVRDLYVVTPVEKVTGVITKMSTPKVNNKTYEAVFMNDTEYLHFEQKNVMGTNSSQNLVNKLKSKASEIELGETYTLYLAADGSYIGFEIAKGAVSTENMVYILGAFSAKEQDKYGTWHTNYKARGVNMNGEEVVILLGKQPLTARDGVPTGVALGDVLGSYKGFYSVADSEDSDARREGIQVLTPVSRSYSPENPTYAIATHSNTQVFTGSDSILGSDGIASYGKPSMKFINLGESTYDQSEPLEAVVTNSLSPGIALSKGPFDMLVTRTSAGRNEIEVFVIQIPTPKGSQHFVYLTDESIKNVGQTPDGYVYTAIVASAGKEQELVFAKAENPVQVFADNGAGFYSIYTDPDGISTFDPAGAKITGDMNYTNNKGKKDSGQVVTNIGFWDITGTRLRGERMPIKGGIGNVDLTNAGFVVAQGLSAPVFDVRSEEEIKRTGEITNMNQILTMRETDPGLMVVFDLYMQSGAAEELRATAKALFIKEIRQKTVGMNSIVYVTEFDPSTKKADGILVRSIVGEMGEEFEDITFDYTSASGEPGFYRYAVNAEGIALEPFDKDVVFYGSWGMVGLHNTLENVDGRKLITRDTTHTCDFTCSNATFEALKTVEFNDSTTVLFYDKGTNALLSADDYEDAMGNKPFRGMTTSQIMNALKENYADVILDYYCDAPVHNETAAEDDAKKDNTTELIVVSSELKEIVPCPDPTHSGTYTPGTGTLSGTVQLTESVTETSALTVSGNVTLCLNGNTLTAPDSLSSGAFITVPSGAKLTICGGYYGGGSISGGGTATCYGVQVEAGGELILESGSISNFKNTGVYVNGGTVTMQDDGYPTSALPVISGNNFSGDGAGVYLNGGTFNLNAGSISGNSAGNGGGVYLKSGTFTMEADTVIGQNSVSGSSKRGGGVYMAGGQFTMNGGQISGNTSAASVGGGVYFASGTFTMHDGEITGNTSNSTYGGGVCVGGGEFSMDGGMIHGNTVNNSNPYGVDVANGFNGNGGGTVTISQAAGKTTVIGSEATKDAKNLLANAGTIEITGGTVYGLVGTVGIDMPAILKISGTAKIQGSVDRDIPVPASVNKQKKACTVSIEGNDVEVSGSVNGATIAGGSFSNDVSDCSISGGTFGGDVSKCTISGNSTFNGTVSESIFGGGTISGSFTLGSNVTIAGGTFIGKTLADLAGTQLAEGVELEQVGENVQVKTGFTSIDPSKTEPCEGSLHGKAITEGGAILSGVNYYLDANLTSGLSIEGAGEVTLCLNGHTISTNGTAAISVDAGITLYLCNCSAAGNIKGGGAGAALLLNDATSVVNMYDNVHINGGTYTGNAGGAVRVNNGTFNMYGGTVSSNTLDSSSVTSGVNGGAGVYLTGGTVNIYAGDISVNNVKVGNTAGGGAGVSVTGAGTFTLWGGSIKENTSAGRGGGVYVKGNGTFIMEGGTVYGNTSANNGAGIATNGGATIKINNGTIEGNTDTGKSNGGGGVALFGAGDVLEMRGGKIINNASSNSTYGGGAIFAGGNGRIEIYGGEISGNQGKYGVRVNGQSATGKVSKVEGGTILETFSVAKPSVFQITGGTFTQKPSDLGTLGSGCTETENGDGTWTVN